MTDHFMISAGDLADLVTHAATASSAAADDNKRRERDAWAKFDAIVERVRACPADITDQDFELTPGEQAMVDDAWKRHEAALPAVSESPVVSDPTVCPQILSSDAQSVRPDGGE